MACTTRRFTVCLHVIEENAKPLIYYREGDPEDHGSILCAVCDPISQQPGGWRRLLPVLRFICSDCCRERWVRN